MGFSSKKEKIFISLFAVTFIVDKYSRVFCFSTIFNNISINNGSGIYYHKR